MLPNKEMTFGGNYMGKCQHMIPNGIKEEDCPVCKPSPEVDKDGILTVQKCKELLYPNEEYFMLYWPPVRELLVAQQAYDKQAMRGPNLEEAHVPDNGCLEVDEKGLVKPLTLEYLLEFYAMDVALAYRDTWRVATARQHQVDLKAQEEAIGKAFASRPLSITVESANTEKAEAVKAERGRVINALIPYLKHSHRDRPINPNLYGGPTYSDATDCEACGMVGQLRRERS